MDVSLQRKGYQGLEDALAQARRDGEDMGKDLGRWQTLQEVPPSFRKNACKDFQAAL